VWEYIGAVAAALAARRQGRRALPVYAGAVVFLLAVAGVLWLLMALGPAGG